MWHVMKNTAYYVADRTFKHRQVQQLAHELIDQEKTTN